MKRIGALLKLAAPGCLLGIFAGSAFAADTGGLKSNPANGITDTAIKIGWMGDLSGPAASVEIPNLHGLQAFVDDTNAKGGVLGRKLQVIDLEDKSRPENATINFRRLINDDHVLAIVDMAGSQVSTPLAPAVMNAKIPVIFPQQTTDVQLQVPYFFNLTTHYADQADVIVARAAKIVGGISKLKLFVVRLSVPSGQEFDTDIQHSLTAQGGAYVGVATVDYTQEDYVPTVVRIQQAIAAGANVLTVHSSMRNALGLFNAMAKADVTLPVIGMQALAEPDLFKEAPASITANFVALQSVLPASSGVPGASEMASYIKSHPQLEEQSLEPIFTQGWLSGWMLVNALERAAKDNAGEGSRETLYKALATKVDTGGLTCTLDFTGARRYEPCATFLTWNGKSLVSQAGFDADSAPLKHNQRAK